MNDRYQTEKAYLLLTWETNSCETKSSQGDQDIHSATGK